jgi:hypothetical protein
MNKTSVALVTFALLSSLLYAEQKTTRRTDSASIEVAGVKLQLGMSKADVAERFVGIQISKMNDDTWFIGDVGTVRFKNNRLIYADKSHSEGDLIDAIFNAVGSLNRQGLSVCRIWADNPFAGEKGYASDGREIDIGVSGERVWIDCGQKGVRISKIKFPTHDNTNVSETLGEFDADAK